MDGEQRRKWQIERECRALVPDREGFASAGLMGHLNEPLLLVATLPCEPLRPFLSFEEPDLAVGILPEALTGLTAQAVSLLRHVTSTSGSLVRFANSGADGSPWTAFVALRRDGGMEVGFGSVVRRRLGQESMLAGVLTYRLFVIVHAIRMLVESQARLVAQVPEYGSEPFEVNIALPRTGGAVLSGFAEGWPMAEHQFEVECACLEQDVHVRMEITKWPSADDDREALIGQLARRVCDAFGIREARFLARHGKYEGRLAPGYG